MGTKEKVVAETNMSLSISQLNKMFQDFNNLRNSGKRVERTVVKDLSSYEDGSQGDSNESYEVYPVEGEKDLFIKLQIGSDSYGYNEFVVGMQFVRPTEKLVTLFEPIK